ncbi:MAG TPA: thioredoxin [Bacteroidetes bacterium]|nr:thioredoxin [Bacteroidota bacterium]
MEVLRITDSEFTQTIKSNKKVVIKFDASWCGTCRLISPKFKKLASDERFQDMTFLEINAEQNPESRKFAGVNNLPFFASIEEGTLKSTTFTGKIERVEELIADLV